MAVAATADKRLIVAYLPKGADGVMLHELLTDATASKLFDPRTGEFSPFVPGWNDLAKDHDLVAVIRR